MKALRELGAKDLFTAGNLACGLLAIFTAFGFLPVLWNGFDIAVSLVILAIVFDLLDGKIARARFTKMSNDFGREFDSLADTVSFGVAPAVIAATRFPAGFHAFGIGFVGFLFYVFCGCVRLARFNLQEEKDCYHGLPIPAAALLVLAASVVLREWSWLAFLALGALMVSGFKIKKML